MEEILSYVKENAALIVSVFALLLTVSSIRATRKHNRLMVQPRMTTFTKTSTDPQSMLTVHVVTLTNSGLGPAIISKYEVLLDGKPIEIDEPADIGVAAMQAVAAQFVPNLCNYGLLKKGYVMAKDESVEVTRATIKDLNPAQALELKRFQLRVHYQSAYQESFVYDTRMHLRAG